MRLRRLACFVALAATLTVAGCGGGGDGGQAPLGDPTPGFRTTTTADAVSAEPEVTADQLDGRSFRSRKVEGHALVPNTTVELSFAASSLTVTAGCTTMDAPYSLSGGHLGWLVAPTKVGPEDCSVELQFQDEWFRQAFIAGFASSLAADGTMVLSSAAVTIDLEPTTAVVAPVGLFGTSWHLQTAVLDGTPTGPDPARSQPGLRLTGSGTAIASTGCNEGTVSVGLTFKAGASVGYAKFDDLSLTSRECPGIAATVDQAVRTVLEGRGIVSIDDDRLTISNGTSTLVYSSG